MSKALVACHMSIEGVDCRDLNLVEVRFPTGYGFGGHLVGIGVVVAETEALGRHM